MLYRCNERPLNFCPVHDGDKWSLEPCSCIVRNLTTGAAVEWHGPATPPKYNRPPRG